MLAERMEHTIRIRRHAGRCQGQYGTERGIHTFAGQILKQPGTHLCLATLSDPMSAEPSATVTCAATVSSLGRLSGGRIRLDVQ